MVSSKLTARRRTPPAPAFVNPCPPPYPGPPGCSITLDPTEGEEGDPVDVEIYACANGVLQGEDVGSAWTLPDESFWSSPPQQILNCQGAYGQFQVQGSPGQWQVIAEFSFPNGATCTAAAAFTITEPNGGGPT